ncbi:hypothetical protein EXE44_14420 [Halorubrum sp. SS7]|uniref:hypothetical protein n=1 Tax=Halorubrum sp. SS7 TaxID=2518119 RepID=UPI0010F5075A|nr:hypothetical protein [Halorubrum sp. SS7]TKX56571.1 hypothetical protein EXE44_14420 [Halorubrum sp. SS7]
MSDDRSDDDAAEYDPFGDDGSEDDPFGDDGSEDDPFDDETFAEGPGDEADDGLDGPDAGGVDDPFAALGEGVGDDPGLDREEDRSGDRGDTPPGADPEPGAPADDPFAELDADAADGPTDGDPFESMGSEDVGEEDVWAALDEGTAVGADATEPGDSAGPTPGTPGAAATGDERVVDKRSYCQRCPHFAAPPETACTHEGTQIVESVDFSRFRVRDCPMVDADDPEFDGE